ncbi:alpha-mannosidase 2 isoform X2 [Episyrphus balteatus]|uniref:alpha-mannosidase 2 isoform X2 n=1 Tax=Episyrphus balteatus TaxID=286459 RepID=UPI00248511ED|nr:alpha-mannosidase 2 isoform X2 [Episyrphus balteatus]
MLRFSRKCKLILCAICVAAFLVTYLLINFSVPADKQEMGHLKKKLENFQSNQNKIDTDDMDSKEKRLLKHPKFGPQQQQLNKKEMFKEMIISAEDNQQCDINGNPENHVNIQMLDVYKNISFDNIDGGVWKQGWNIKYDPLQFNEHHKLKVFVVPHSHNDPGWIKTFDAYYEHDTKHILSNMLRHLKENPDMRFIWAEMSFFSRFYEGLGQNSKMETKKLVQNHQLDFVTGGWVMSDEANSHWLSILMQLTEGHTWLKKNLNVTPTSSWAIDPFGHSPTLPYILKHSGFENLLIQRTHYSVKKRLARTKELEFRWRQIWDESGRTELFTHMMPFYSYDIPHTCGPDPKICCQFDFKRIPGFGIACPWHVQPQAIDDQNVARRAEMLVDQWRKKAELYKTNSVLIPLGDDFRYSQSTEWEAQMRNYEMLFDYINNERKMFTEAKFATLQEYFDSVRKEHDLASFPTLSGDFFTYADRDDHYWSGYYTSRPFHKRMDRVLLHHIRSAEMLHAWSSWDPSARFDKMLQNARRELSLFQHHDGITGTAKTHVVFDYANRTLNSIKDCRFVMQQAVYRLLTKESIYSPDYKFTYFFFDESHWPGPDDGRTTIILGDELPTKYVVFHNSLSKWREELVELYVSKPYISVRDLDDKAIPAQISPVWSWHGHHDGNAAFPQASTTKYRLLFKVNVPPLGLVTYVIQSEPGETMPKSTTLGKNRILTISPYTVNLGDYPDQVKFAEPRDISLRVGDGPTVAFHGNGLLKSIQIDDSSSHIPTNLNFLRYGTRMNGPMSGAYLFLPYGEASPLPIVNPVVLVQEGPLESSVTTGLPFAVHQTILRGGHPEIRNMIDIGVMDNTEIVMRIATRIQSGETFFTDLNGLQMIKRKRLQKIPLQANYYPIPSSIFIEDDNLRLTIVSAQPLGGSSLRGGELEIMQDRRLAQDDERGLGQGVLDNRPVLHIFRLIVEKIESCSKLAEEYPGGFLTKNAYNEYQTVLHPIDKFIWVENDWVGVQRSFGENHEQLEEGIQLAVMRNIPNSSNGASKKNNKSSHETGLVVHRTNLMECNADSHRSGVANIKRLMSIAEEENINIYKTPLTFIGKKQQIASDEINFCPMDTKAFIIQR